MSDSNFFLFVLKFNYGCIWNKINGDHFSPTDGVFECSLMIMSAFEGEGSQKHLIIPGFFQDSSGPLCFIIPSPLSPRQRKRSSGVLILLHQLIILIKEVMWQKTHCLHLYSVRYQTNYQSQTATYFVKGVFLRWLHSCIFSCFSLFHEEK